MASEEPKKLPLATETADPMPADKMEVDAPVATTEDQNVNTDVQPSHSEDAPVTNGDAQQPTTSLDDKVKNTQNEEVHATDNNPQESSPSKEASSTVPPEDTNVPETNGSSQMEGKTDLEKSVDKAEEQPEENDKRDDRADDAVASSTQDEPTKTQDNPTEAGADVVDATSKSATEPKTADEESNNIIVPTVGTSAELMDVDDSTERPELASAAQPDASTQDALPVSDAPAASHSDAAQATKLSKLEIKPTQDGAEDISPTQKDVTMVEAAASPTKIAREREEEDDADEPLAKRAKTTVADEVMTDAPAVARNSSVETSTQEARSAGLDRAIPDNMPITPYQNKKTREVLGNVKKTKTGGNFRKSVQELWPGLWNDYKAKIENPIDISAIEAKLREDKYANYGQFKADVNKLYDNAVAFNGPQHEVSRAAAQVREYILIRMPDIIFTKTPAKPEKGKAQPTRYTEPRAATQPRRPSYSQTQGPGSNIRTKGDATSPAFGSSAQAFAIPPSGIPQIRRDSTRDDHDRPKRPIHPPKNRDPEYASKATRKKKLDPEQRFIDAVLEEVKKPKYFSFNQWFLAPVDPVALNIPNYFNVVRKPMDLATMTEKNYDGGYKSTKDLEKDVRLMVTNSELFNGPEHEVTSFARQLEELFKSQLAGKDKYMERYFPSAAPMHASAVSPQRSAAESDDDSDVDGDEEDSDAILSLQQRLNEEQEKLNQLLNSKKPDLTMMEVQQSMVTMLQRKLVEERTKFHNEKRPKKKKPSHSKSKSKSMGNAPGSSKKMSGSAHPVHKKVAGAGGGSNNNSFNKKTALPKKRPIGALEKAVIAEGINELDGNTLIKAVEIIKRDTGQNENDEGEMELDIDSLTVDALAKLYDLINKAHPDIRQTLAKKPEFSNTVNAEAESKAKPGSLPKAKKNKPMNKHEQERKIEQLRELKAQLQRHGSGSQEPPPGEAELPAAIDSSESSDSEEE